MTEEVVDTTTKFIGDIVFNNGEKDINASDLVTVDEVNDVLKECVKKDEVIDVNNVRVEISILSVNDRYKLDIDFNNPPKIIYIDAPPERKETYTLEYNTVELLSSLVKVFIEQYIENIVYRDSFDELNERVKKLEK